METLLQTLPKAQTKEEIYFSVCNSILKMEAQKGHFNWTLSDISRESKVTRSLIYYYFGKEKEIILIEAYKFIISIFFGDSPPDAIPMNQRLKKVLTDLQNMPYLFMHYYMQKNADSEFGRMIKTAETLMIKNMKLKFPDMNEVQVLDLYLKQLGAIAFQLSGDQVDLFFDERLI